MLDRIADQFEESARTYTKAQPAVGDAWIALTDGLVTAARGIAVRVKAAVEKIDENYFDGAAAAGLPDGFAATPTSLAAGRVEILRDILSAAAASYAAKQAAAAQQAAAPPVTTTAKRTPTPTATPPRRVILPDLSDLGAAPLPAHRAKGPNAVPSNFPDYHQEEVDAAARIKNGFYDFSKYPCSDIYELLQEHKYTCTPRVLEVRCRQRDCMGCRQWLDDREMTNAQLRFAEAVAGGAVLDAPALRGRRLDEDAQENRPLGRRVPCPAPATAGTC